METRTTERAVVEMQQFVDNLKKMQASMENNHFPPCALNAAKSGPTKQQYVTSETAKL
jgi:hypothetical protein